MLSSAVSRTTATGNDSANVYNYNYRIFDRSELLVTLQNLTTLAESVLAITTDFTVQGVGQVSGTVTLVNAGQAWLDAGGFLSANYKIIIRRVRPLTQITSIRNSSTFYAAVHEDEFDMLTMDLQQHDDQLQRTVMLPETVTSSDFNPVLPTAFKNPPAGAAVIINPTQDGFTLGSPVVGWKSVTLPYTQFQAAATTKQIDAFTLPKGCILMGVALKHSIAFAGGAISDVYLDLGIVGNDDKFLSTFDVFAAVADTNFLNGMPAAIQSFAGDTAIKVKATSASANLAALTAGAITIYYWYMNLNQGS